MKTKKTVFLGFIGSTLLLITMGTAVRIGVPGRIHILCEISGLVIILSSSAILYIIFCNNVQIVSDNLCSKFRQVKDLEQNFFDR